MNVRIPLLRLKRERRAVPGEVQGLGPGADRARAAAVGRDGGAGRWARRDHRGGSGYGDWLFHDSARPPGTGLAVRPRPLADSAPRRWPQEDAGERSDAAARSRGVGGAHRLGRPDVAFAVDILERAPPDGGPPTHGPSRQPATGGRTAGGGRV